MTLCLHRTWLVAHDSKSETCADCGMQVIYPAGVPTFLGDDYEPTLPRIGDAEPISDEYRLVGWKRARV